MNAELSMTWVLILIFATVWEMIWKSMALWRASKRNQKWWFGSILVINSVGILPLLYLLLTKEKKDE